MQKESFMFRLGFLHFAFSLFLLNEFHTIPTVMAQTTPTRSISAPEEDLLASSLLPIRRPLDFEKARKGKLTLTQEFINKPSLLDTRDLLFNLWWVWEPSRKQEAFRSNFEQRKKMIYKRYGYVPAPFDNFDLPLGLTYSRKTNQIVPNCLACHGGYLLGKTHYGMANVSQDIATFFEDVENFKGLLKLKKPAHGNPAYDYYNHSAGAFNAWSFSSDRLKLRDPDLDLMTQPQDFGKQVQVDMDPPVWWNIKYKNRLYMDGVFEHNHRALMQFAMDNNSGQQLRDLEGDFVHIAAFIDSIQPPKYPFPVNEESSTRGQVLFQTHCGGCHGNYSTDPSVSFYPEKKIPLAVVGTDPLRASPEGLPKAFREFFRDSWFGYYGSLQTSLETGVYVAPPLVGIWASAPYLHNGSVPTLKNLLFPETRPKIWKIKTLDSYDQEKIGLHVDVYEKIPESVTLTSDKRKFVDTTKPGRSRQGHLFGTQLDASAKQDIMEYLKTL
jgi:hypothetical protein